MSLVRTVARNSLWSGLDLIVEMLLPPIISIIVARAMGPAKLGEFSYVIWISTVAASLGGLAVSGAARKYMADYAGQKRPEVFLAILRVGLVFQAIISLLLVGAGLCWVFSALPRDERGFATLAMVSILPAGLMPMATAVNNAVEELRPNVIASIAAGLMHAAGMCVTLVMGWDLVGLAGALLASKTADCVVRWLLTGRRLPQYLQAMGASVDSVWRAARLPPGLAREIAKFSGQSTILVLLAIVVWNRSEIIFLKRFCDIRQVAFYSIAFSLSLIPGQIVGPFSLAAGVSVFAEQGRSAKAGLHVTHQYWRYLVLLILPVCLGLSVLSGPLMQILYGVQYREAAPVLTLAAALGMFAPLANPATSLITAAGGQGKVVGCGLLAAAATIALDYWLVLYHGAIGGALANGLGQAISTISTIIIARRYVGFRISLGFTLRVLLAALAMAATVALLLHLVSNIVGVVVGPFLGVVAYALFLRIGRAVEEEDIDRLLRAESVFPSRVRPLYRKLVDIVAYLSCANRRLSSPGADHDQRDQISGNRLF
ncbi:MAG: oligosaccharide flippase family protein [Polyangia bacterium]|jgi:O-antigen/teichoic acid export membrane protein